MQFNLPQHLRFSSRRIANEKNIDVTERNKNNIELKMGARDNTTPRYDTVTYSAYSDARSDLLKTSKLVLTLSAITRRMINVKSRQTLVTALKTIFSCKTPFSHLKVFSETIHLISHGFTSVINPLKMLGENSKVRKLLAFHSWFTSFSFSNSPRQPTRPPMPVKP